MSPAPIKYDSSNLDLSARFVQSKVVAASPALAAITAIATVAIPADIGVISGIQLTGWAAFTVGTSGTACKLDLRQTGVAGAVVATTGATTGGVAAGNLVDINVQGFDTAGVLPGQVYALCLTVTAGAAASTVSAVQITAMVV